jgi:FAD/FMN-containing dehydrogenase
MTEDSVTIRASTVEVVSESVRHAQRESLPLTVVAGGHGPWSHVPAPGMRIELTGLSDIEIDGTLVRIGGGAVWGDVAVALGAHGLSISSGDTASVGVGGLTLGGGIGWMVRAWGIAADQLVGAQVVTASGDIVEASETQNPDLFWALRGGGGNFGIVTRFDFQAHRIPGIAVGEHPITGDTALVIRTVRDLMRDAPNELTVTYMDVPPMDPSAPAGARVSAVWADAAPDALRTIMAPVAALPGVEAEYTSPAYRDILIEMPEPPDDAGLPPGFIGGNGLFADLDDELIGKIVAFRAGYPASVVMLRSLGGAFGAAPQESTPFPARDARWFVMVGAFDIPGLVDDATRERISADWERIESGRIAEYGNFAATERPDAVPGMFGPDAFERLRQIKKTWDPQNLFRRNHNVV